MGAGGIGAGVWVPVLAAGTGTTTVEVAAVIVVAEGAWADTAVGRGRIKFGNASDIGGTKMNLKKEPQTPGNRRLPRSLYWKKEGRRSSITAANAS